jgi:peptidoglycan L-alanyl-D-glutamate endopeptidase CwlK
MNLIDSIKTIQRAVGVEADGVVGPETVNAILKELALLDQVSPNAVPLQALDARTLATLATLDSKARDRFESFTLLAKATAATLGCEYVAISGHRTWEEQDKLFAQRPRVTKAAGGYSNHNFGIAVDFAVFSGKIYADESNPALAERVHRACAAHASGCGLEWGGNWKSFRDIPHYEIATGLTMEAKRLLYKQKGSVL